MSVEPTLKQAPSLHSARCSVPSTVGVQPFGTLTAEPACTTAAGSAVSVPKGCTPTVDGTLHLAEWSDGACFNVGSTDMVVYAKYDANSVYLATSGQPTCG